MGDDLFGTKVMKREVLKNIGTKDSAVTTMPHDKQVKASAAIPQLKPTSQSEENVSGQHTDLTDIDLIQQVAKLDIAGEKPTADDSNQDGATIQKTPSTEEEEENAYSMEEAQLSAAFGRLLVIVGMDLTLDDCIGMAFLFSISRSQVDLLRRISLYETPGNKLLDILRECNIINMYDVTNLQNASKLMKLEFTEQTVSAFQNQVDHEQHEQHKAEEIILVADLPETTQGAISKCSKTEQESRSVTDIVAQAENNTKETEFADPLSDYTFVDMVGRHLDVDHPQGHDWRELAQNLGFNNMSEIETFDRYKDHTEQLFTTALSQKKLTSVNHLVEILTSMERLDVVEDIRKYMGGKRQSSSNCSATYVDDGSQFLEIHFSIVNSLGKRLDPNQPNVANWRQLASEFNFDSTYIRNIEHKYQKPTMAILQAACKNGSLKSYKQLDGILIKIERRDAVIELRKQLKVLKI